MGEREKTHTGGVPGAKTIFAKRRGKKSLGVLSGMVLGEEFEKKRKNQRLRHKPKRVGVRRVRGGKTKQGKRGVAVLSASSLGRKSKGKNGCIGSRKYKKYVRWVTAKMSGSHY